MLPSYQWQAWHNSSARSLELVARHASQKRRTTQRSASVAVPFVLLKPFSKSLAGVEQQPPCPGDSLTHIHSFQRVRAEASGAPKSGQRQPKRPQAAKRRLAFCNAPINPRLFFASSGKLPSYRPPTHSLTHSLPPSFCSIEPLPVSVQARVPVPGIVRYIHLL